MRALLIHPRASRRRSHVHIFRHQIHLRFTQSVPSGTLQLLQHLPNVLLEAVPSLRTHPSQRADLARKNLLVLPTQDSVEHLQEHLLLQPSPSNLPLLDEPLDLEATAMQVRLRWLLSQRMTPLPLLVEGVPAPKAILAVQLPRPTVLPEQLLLVLRKRHCLLPPRSPQPSRLRAKPNELARRKQTTRMMMMIAFKSLPLCVAHLASDHLVLPRVMGAHYVGAMKV